MSETLGLKNVNMLSKERYDGVADPSNEELWAVSGLGVGFPSDRYIDLTLGASGTSYTAPASGWFTFAKYTGSVDNAICAMYTNKLYTSAIPNNSDQGICGMTLPVSKGDVLKTEYTINGGNIAFRFYYAVGEE